MEFDKIDDSRLIIEMMDIAVRYFSTGLSQHKTFQKAYREVVIAVKESLKE